MRFLLATFLLLLLALALASSASAAYAPDLLRSLPVRAESNDGYDRDLFDHWIDANGNSCDTREEVLLRQNLLAGASCSDRTGSWYSAYDDLRFTTSSSLDIDHFIPLAEAWGSGAKSWDEGRRERFANDLYGYSLIAVSASSNRSKSDRDPAEWLPPRAAFLCTYLARWVAVKYRWRLAVDSAERGAIRSSWRSCPARKLQVSKIKRAS